jgi:hypothetical protein
MLFLYSSSVFLVPADIQVVPSIGTYIVKVVLPTLPVPFLVLFFVVIPSINTQQLKDFPLEAAPYQANMLY